MVPLKSARGLNLCIDPMPMDIYVKVGSFRVVLPRSDRPVGYHPTDIESQQYLEITQKVSQNKL